MAPARLTPDAADPSCGAAGRAPGGGSAGLPASRWRAALLPLAVGAAAALAHAPLLGAGFVWDDAPYVLTSPALAPGARGLLRALRADLYAFAVPPDAPSGYWRPLATLSLWANARLGGASAASLHAGNLLLQALCAALLAALLRARLGPRAALPAAIAALLWALHPESVEAVAWISCRYDLLATAAALALLAVPWRPGPARAAVHGAIFLCGLLSKEGFAAMAAVVIADDLAAGRRPRAALPRLAAVGAALALWLAARAALGIAPIARPAPGGAAVGVLDAVGRYLARAAWPFPLTVSHPVPAPEALAVAGGAAALAALAALAWRARALAPAAALAAAPLVPAGLAVALLGAAPERYFHLPSAGLAWLLGAGLAALLARAPRSRPLVAAASLALAAGCAAAVAARAPAWRSDEALFGAAAHVDPGDALANLWLGIDAGRRGRLEEARERLGAAAARDPRSARAANALAWAELRAGDAAAAREAARRAVALAPASPEARLHLASALHLAGDHAGELAEAERAVRLAPRFREARITRALARCEVERDAACEEDLAQLQREGALAGADALVAGAEAALRRGDLALARTRIERLRAERPADPRLRRLTAAAGALPR